MIRAPLCDRCGAPTAWPVERCRECAGRRLAFARARAGVAYEGAAVALLRSWKEHGWRKLATLAAGIVTTTVQAPAVETVTFVPSVPDRERWRGGNPARGLAEELSVHWQLSCSTLLARRSSPRRQRGLSTAARRTNVRDAFAAPDAVPGRVALVDDVYTTGATVAAAASALRAAGAYRVEVVTFARTLRTGGIAALR